MQTITKSVADLKAGDVVEYYGSKFLVLENARESNAHRPVVWGPSIGLHNRGHIVQDGPSTCAVAKAECIERNAQFPIVPVGGEWVFQGHTSLVFHSVIAQ